MTNKEFFEWFFGKEDVDPALKSGILRSLVYLERKVVRQIIAEGRHGGKRPHPIVVKDDQTASDFFISQMTRLSKQSNVGLTSSKFLRDPEVIRRYGTDLNIPDRPTDPRHDAVMMGQRGNVTAEYSLDDGFSRAMVQVSASCLEIARLGVISIFEPNFSDVKVMTDALSGKWMSDPLYKDRLADIGQLLDRRATWTSPASIGAVQTDVDRHTNPNRVIETIIRLAFQEIFDRDFYGIAERSGADDYPALNEFMMKAGFLAAMFEVWDIKPTDSVTYRNLIDCIIKTAQRLLSSKKVTDPTLLNLHSSAHMHSHDDVYANLNHNHAQGGLVTRTAEDFGLMSHVMHGKTTRWPGDL